MRRKLNIDKQRVVQENKRLATEERRTNLLEDLVNRIKAGDGS